MFLNLVAYQFPDVLGAARGAHSFVEALSAQGALHFADGEMVDDAQRVEAMPTRKSRDADVGVFGHENLPGKAVHADVFESLRF